MTYLAICAIFRNEEPYLKEWLSYHYSQGVRHFVLYNNESTDGSVAVIEQWAHRAIVVIVDWPGKGNQVAAYADMISRYRYVAEWCAFIDCDEFLCPQSNVTLIDILLGLGGETDGLYVHWLMFGSAGHVERQPGFVTETFCWRAPDDFGAHFLGKSVIRLSAATGSGIHTLPSRGPMVNDAGWQVDQALATGQIMKSHRLVALNHYFTKSREEWNDRRSRGRADKLDSDPQHYRPDHEFGEHDINLVYDDRAAMFMQAARAMFYLPSSVATFHPLPSPAHLKTVHGTLLCFDEVSLQPTHCSTEDISATCSPLVAEFAGDGHALLHFRHPAMPGGVVPIDGQSCFAVITVNGGPALHLRADELFLCAEAGSGHLRVNRIAAESWETFVAIATPRA